ncbi:MAG: hypothetical protein PHX08_10535 [Lachnospiraceae bacterium]|nr:hypothetical protein [Lachnospiraceae bacterium]
MKRALYTNYAGETQYIDADVITPKTNEEIFKGNLRCENKNCCAELIYNERQKGKFIRYFSTKPGSEHIKGCPNEINHKGSKGSKIRVSGGKQSVSDSHIQDSIKDAIRNFRNKLHPEIQTAKKGKAKKHNVPKTDDNIQDSDVTVVSEAMTTGSDTVVFKEKEAYIYKRETTDIADEDLNTFKEVHSLVEDVRFEDDCAYIDLISQNGDRWSLLFDTPFKSQYEQEFYLLSNIQAYVYMKKSLNEEVICGSFGECKLMAEKKVVQIYSYKHFSLDGLWFYEIIRLMNKAS